MLDSTADAGSQKQPVSDAGLRRFRRGCLGMNYIEFYINSLSSESSPPVTMYAQRQ
jgi:hypothetical protein